MMGLLNYWLLRLADVSLGWLLRLPVDAALILVAVGTSALLTLARKWTTNQDLLARCAADKKRLRQLLREAKQRKDRETVKRLHTLKGRIALLQLRQEGKPLLLALLPVLLVATWAFSRLEFHPPQADEPITVVAHLPFSAAGRLIHVVPVGVTETGWIQTVATNGEAHWRLRLPADATELVFRYRESTYTHPVVVGQHTYAPPLVFHDEQVYATEVRLQPVKLFGVVPGFWLLPPWMVVYLLIVVPFVPLLKKLLRIY